MPLMSESAHPYYVSAKLVTRLYLTRCTAHTTDKQIDETNLKVSQKYTRQQTNRMYLHLSSTQPFGTLKTVPVWGGQQCLSKIRQAWLLAQERYISWYICDGKSCLFAGCIWFIPLAEPPIQLMISMRRLGYAPARNASSSFRVDHDPCH